MTSMLFIGPDKTTIYYYGGITSKLESTNQS